MSGKITTDALWVEVLALKRRLNLLTAGVGGAGSAITALTGDVTATGPGSAVASIAADAVTYGQIQNVSATSRILGRKTSGSGDVEECTLSEVLDFISSAAQGDILYRGSSSWARLGAGTSGQFLKTLGAGANPAWATPAGGTGSWGSDFVAPVDGDYAWVNQGGATKSATTVWGHDGVYLFAPGGTATNSLRIRKKSAPATPYTITAYMVSDPIAEEFGGYGIGWRQSSDGKLVTLSLYAATAAATGLKMDGIKWTNETTALPSAYVSVLVGEWPRWLRILDDGTNRKMYFSTDGQNWFLLHSVSRTDHITPDEVLFYANSANATWGHGAALLSWKEE